MKVYCLRYKALGLAGRERSTVATLSTGAPLVAFYCLENNRRSLRGI